MDVDHSSFAGRWRYYRTVLSPSLLLAGQKELANAKQIVTGAKSSSSKEELTSAQALYASAYHPDTGNVNPLVGRMAFQIPGNAAIVAAMLTFYKSTWQVVGLQFANQAFMAFTNYTNRNAQSPVTDQQAMSAFFCATTGSVLASVALKRAFSNVGSLGGKLVPFLAVCVGNCVNVPLMRFQDVSSGITLRDPSTDEPLGASPSVGRQCVSQVVATRVVAAVPSMVAPPLVVALLERRRLIRQGTPLSTLVQCGIITLCAWHWLPVSCALWPQQASCHVDKLEPDLRQRIAQQRPGLTTVVFNKGL